MSSTSERKLHKFVLFAPEAKDSPRAEVLPRHRQAMVPLIKSGFATIAGMMVTPESIVSEDAPKTAFGSLIIYEAETIEEVEKVVKADIYYTSGVWDHEKLTIMPFIPAPIPDIPNEST